jgi:archaemetzincin
MPRPFVFAAVALGLLGCSQVLEVERGIAAPGAAHNTPPTKDELRRLVLRLRPLHTPPDPPRPGSWLAHVKEPGQTFEQYLKLFPVRPREARCTNRRCFAIYVVPIGELDAPRQQILTSVVDYLSIFFCLPVKVARSMPESAIPRKAWREHPRWGIRQVNAEHLLYRVLAPRLPRDATAMLGLTGVDLYPREDWNYVFGFASYHHRVGVVSMYRMGTPIEGHVESQRTVLSRTLRIAAHETSHTLAIRHCIKHRCNMGGMNYTGELDRRPLALCPECLAKVLWATGCDPAARYRRLARFCRRHGLEEQARRFEALRRAVTEAGGVRATGRRPGGAGADRRRP